MIKIEFVGRNRYTIEHCFKKTYKNGNKSLVHYFKPDGSKGTEKHLYTAEEVIRFIVDVVCPQAMPPKIRIDNCEKDSVQEVISYFYNKCLVNNVIFPADNLVDFKFIETEDETKVIIVARTILSDNFMILHRRKGWLERVNLLSPVGISHHMQDEDFIFQIPEVVSWYGNDMPNCDVYTKTLKVKIKGNDAQNVSSYYSNHLIIKAGNWH